MADSGCNWLSAHLHFGGDLYGEPADRLILDVVAPVAAECLRRRWIRRFFFLRFNVRGPHVRFRLQGRPEVLERRVRPLLERTAAAAGSARGLEWVPYEPELGRYGGARGVIVAERLFHHSSRTALALLPRLRTGARSARLGKALLASLVHLHAFAGRRDHAAASAEVYAESYLRQVQPDPENQGRMTSMFERGWGRQAETLATWIEAAWTALEGDDGLPAEWRRYRRRLEITRDRLHQLFRSGRLLDRAGEPYRTWSEAVGSIWPSYLHLTNNRLGVRIQEEIYLAVVASRTLAGERRAAAG